MPGHNSGAGCSAGNQTPTQGVVQASETCNTANKKIGDFDNTGGCDKSSSNQGDGEKNFEKLLANQLNKLVNKKEVNYFAKDIHRKYMLTEKTKFHHFYDYLTSELRTRDLLFVIEPNETQQRHRDLDQETLAFIRSGVRELIINRVEEAYHEKVFQYKDPVLLLNKLREIKNFEFNISGAELRAKLYELMPNPREKASEFIDKFEELVRNIDISEANAKITELEKRNAFFRAMKSVIPNLSAVELLSSHRLGQPLSYEELKTHFLQWESDRVNKAKRENQKDKTALIAGRRSNDNDRCYQCGKSGHYSWECINGSNQDQCYRCQEFGHKSFQCPSGSQRSVPYNKSNRYKNKNNSNSTKNPRAKNKKRKLEQNGDNQNKQTGAKKPKFSGQNSGNKPTKDHPPQK